MNYLVTITDGNDYYCSCCRRTWTRNEEMEFETDDAAREYAKSYDSTMEKAKVDSSLDTIYRIGEHIYG
jgi:hypothetical protein